VRLRPIGIRGRLTLSYVLIFAMALGGFGIVSYEFLKSRMDTALSEELAERAAGLRGYLRFDNGAATLRFNPNDPEQAYFVQVSTRYYQIYDANSGMLLAQSPELDFLGMQLTRDELRTIISGPPFYDVTTDQGRLRFRNEVIRAPTGEVYLVQIGASMKQMEDDLRNYFQLLLWLIPVSIAVASLIGWWTSGRALRPITALAESAQRIELTELKNRLPVRGTGDELDQLAGTFNETFSRLARTVDEMKQFTASISHELRTPLSILRGEAEIALMHAGSEEEYRRVLSSQLEEFDKLTRMINQLLTLARAEAGETPITRKPVDLVELVKSLTDQMLPVAESREVQLHFECERDSIVVTGDANWLERVVLNLVDNAIKFTQPGGSVKVAVRSSEDKAVLEVTDTGAGIQPDSLPHIFERFYQADAARSGGEGAGLGLSLVKWAVDQHGGTIDVASQPDHGTTFRVNLPLIKRS